MNLVSSFVRFIIFVFDNLEHLLLTVVSRLAPWAAPLAPAYFVAQAIQERLNAPPWVAWAVGVMCYGGMWLLYWFIAANLSRVFPVASPVLCGFVYLLQREDGIYKIGHTNNLERRIKMHVADYRMHFELIKTWRVTNRMQAERVALKMTRPFAYREDYRAELRQMTPEQVAGFIRQFGKAIAK